MNFIASPARRRRWSPRGRSAAPRLDPFDASSLRLRTLARQAALACLLSLLPSFSALHAESRIALVVGNSRYTDVPPLANPVNDANLIAGTLSSLNFKVIQSIDADRAALTRAVNDFGDRLATAGEEAVGLFFYAGHAVQLGNTNYMIPIGESIENDNQVQTNAVPAQWVLDRMAQAGSAFNMVILDACRTPPPKLLENSRSVKSGLTQMEGPSGVLIAYSAGPGKVAFDGRGGNSPYAKALADAMTIPGIRVEDTFREVRKSVQQATREKQMPWESISTLGAPFYFLPSQSDAAPPAAVVAQASAPSQPAQPAPRFEVVQQRPPVPAYEIERTDRVMFAAKRANVRSGPDMSFPTVGRLEIGQEVQVTGVVIGSSWLRIQHGGRRLFVHGSLLADSLATSPASSTRAAAQNMAEVRWQSLADGKPWDLEKYLNEFPDGEFAGEARRRALAMLCEDSYIAQSYLTQLPDGQFADDAKRCLLTVVAETDDLATLGIYMEPFAEGTEAIAAAARRKAEWLRAWQDMRNTDDAAALEPLLAQVDDPALKRRVRDRILAAINSATDLHRLRQYTRQFPAGSAVQEAQRRIAVLSTWSQIEASEDLSLFEKFLAQTSDAELADLAKDRIIGLINDSTDAERLKQYVEDHPGGVGVQAAEYRIVLLGREQESQQEAYRVFQDCPKCPQMVVIPAGSFTMGSPDFESGRSKDEGPRRRVVIEQAFAMSTHEVTFAEWDACLADARCNGWQPPAPWGRGKMPVVNVSRFDVEAFAAWLNRTIGAQKYRLPSEAEWEYAARANATAPFNLGPTVLPTQANFNGRGSGYKLDRNILFRRKTTEVGTFPRNAFDLYDTHGNVAEWVADCWHQDYTNAPKNSTTWGHMPCRYGIVRGGSWQSRLPDLRLTNRQRTTPGDRLNSVGFRVARDLP